MLDIFRMKGRDAMRKDRDKMHQLDFKDGHALANTQSTQPLS